MSSEFSSIPEYDLQTVLSEIFRNFQTGADFSHVKRIGSGHINDSFLVETNSLSRFVLQSINHKVFRNIPGLMNNILKVTHHLEQKIISGFSYCDSLKPIRVIPTKDNKIFLQDDNGNFWRLYNYIDGTHSFDLVEDDSYAYEAGRVFGIFQYLTADIPLNDLVETIPHFHDPVARLGTFKNVVTADPVGRVQKASKEIVFVLDRAEEMLLIPKLAKENKIPLRVTHNDTKFNNILFDDSGKAVCVVDLDTIMPGYVLFDFGDALRTGANTGAEDEQDLQKVGLDLGLFESYSKGYLEISRQFLNEYEISHLAFSAKFMTWLIGLRFLTDYLDGDNYYRIVYPGHNLIRAKAQFRLLESMEENYYRMQEIIRNNS